MRKVGALVVSYLTFRKNSLELTELSNINKVSLV